MRGEPTCPRSRRRAIENNTSVATGRARNRSVPKRPRIYSSRCSTSRTLDSVALEATSPREDAKLAGEALKALFGKDGLEAGYVVAMRGFRPGRETHHRSR